MLSINQAGKRLIEKWGEIYNTELERLQRVKNDPNYQEGWCIVDNTRFIKTLEDECGILLFGYGDQVFSVMDEWKADGWEMSCGFMFYDIENELKTKYFS